MLIQTATTSTDNTKRASSLRLKKERLVAKFNRYLAKASHNLNLSGWSQFK